MVNKINKFFAAAAALAIVGAGRAMAAADTLTGIDFESEVTTLVASNKLAITAGVTLFVLMLAVTLGPKLIKKLSGK
jgi:hypothetical protein